MNPIDSHANPTEDSHSNPGLDFETGMRQARAHLEKGEVDSALEVLSALEKNYVGASAIFEILGDAFLAKGDVGEGIRYKTLHQILKGTFRIVREESARGRLAQQGPTSIPPEVSRPAARRFLQQGTVRSDEERAEEEVVPVTLSMAQELMRQGHYDRASRIFDRLLLQSPEEQSVKEARDVARRKRRDKHLLNIFQRWLTNIEHIRSGESTVR